MELLLPQTTWEQVSNAGRTSLCRFSYGAIFQTSLRRPQIRPPLAPINCPLIMVLMKDDDAFCTVLI